MPEPKREIKIEHCIVNLMHAIELKLVNQEILLHVWDRDTNGSFIFLIIFKWRNENASDAVRCQPSSAFIFIIYIL